MSHQCPPPGVATDIAAPLTTSQRTWGEDTCCFLPTRVARSSASIVCFLEPPLSVWVVRCQLRQRSHGGDGRRRRLCIGKHWGNSFGNCYADILRGFGGHGHANWLSRPRSRADKRNAPEQVWGIENYWAGSVGCQLGRPSGVLCSARVSILAVLLICALEQATLPRMAEEWCSGFHQARVSSLWMSCLADCCSVQRPAALEK